MNLHDTMQLKQPQRVSLRKLCGCSLHKAAPVVTNVGKYVAKNAPDVSGKIASVLSKSAKKIAAQVAKQYVNKMLKADSTDSVVQAILDELDLQGVSVSIIDAMNPDIVKAFNEAGVLGVEQVNIDATPDITKHIDKAAIDYADSHGAELAVGLTATTEEALRGAITSAIESGASTTALSDTIQSMFAFGEARANAIARTELATAHVQGNVQGWRETGMVEKKEWIMGDLHDIEDECDENAAEGAIELEEAFSSGNKFPPAHPNCICDILPVLAKGGE